ncbi:type II toxin-antitoxin system VapC family toxin [Haloarchaeobius litoreus]|uniref:Ribonuclease VapC n=1 Tax=Haloarchaeobius litoreus TaxID=755306 RepID=A0ABD6DS73_9EURY|nr:type II toxin-antitoxin system VapC family toxin [Haloarchaeobius litoreus]
MYCLDANIWIYYLDETLSEHDAVSDSVSGILAEEPLFSTTVLQMEVVHYLQHQLADSQQAIDQFLHLEDVTTAELTQNDVSAAAETLHSHPDTGIGGRDATVVAAMDRNGVTELWTHDGGLKRLEASLDWLTVVDPVEES